MPMRDDLLNPISGDNPSGASLRYAPVYDKIKEARRQDDDAPQGEWKHERKVADYKQVIKLAGEALATKSKDLQLAAWLTEAALRVEGFAGLLAGLRLMQGLVENFWDTLYPELEDGDAEFRAAPLDWIGSRLGQAIHEVSLTREGHDWFQYKQSRQIGYEADAADNDAKQEARAQAIAEGKVTGEEFDSAFNSTPKAFYVQAKQDVDDSLAAIDSLSEACEPKFGDAAPGFAGLRSALEEVGSTVGLLLQKKREIEPDEVSVSESAPADSGQVAAASADGAAAAPARKTVSEEPADRDDAFTRIALVAKYLRREDPYNPAPYLMLRGLRWGELRAGGESPSLELLAPPATQIRQELKRLAVESNWVELIEAAENAMAMPCGRAWLDLQRYAVKALEGYGYPVIAAAIRSELRAVLADLPQWPQWTLADDTPTANAETQAWLKEVGNAAHTANGLGAMPAMDGRPAEAAAPGETVPPDAFQVAMEAARAGDVQQAIEILSREIAHERSGRARFHRKIQLAQICMSTGHEAIAYPILNEMADEIELRKLEDWEASEVVAHPLALLYRCMNQLDGDAELKRKLYARLCRLDPVQALACTK
ncbi:MAG TPA: type VI secretion system protein TssA [Bryobacteraceae bacterium]|nr:type VI secretion system protein TssA [Bryobacteraceae bacterium]